MKIKMRWKYSLVLCLGIVLFFTVTACGNDQRTISKAAAEKTDIPVRYKKELEYLNFKIEHIDMDADKDLYQSCAKRVEFDPEKLTGYFLGSEFQKCIHIDENGMIYLTDENRSLLVNQDYLAYMSGSRLQTYVSENLPEWRNGGHMDSVCTYTEFTERPIQAEKSFLEKQLSGLGIQNLDFWKCYGMDEGTYWLGIQEWQGAPVFTTIFCEGMNEEWMPVQILDTPNGMELVNIIYCFQFERKNEKIELLPFDEIVKALEQEYAMVLTDNKHDVVEAKLYFWVDVNQEEVEYKMEPVWVFTIHEYREGEEDSYKEYQEMINAETGKCLEVRG